MQYVIRPKQDYSSRLGGSWGQIVVSSADEVDDFRLNDGTTIVVETDDGTPITDSMTPAEWRTWKERHNP